MITPSVINHNGGKAMNATMSAAAAALLRRSILLAFIMLILLPLPTHSSCLTSYSFGKENKVFATCQDLQVQSATLAWTLQEGAAEEEGGNRTLDVLFSGVAPSSSGWVGWGLNLGPNPAMVGTQAFIAFQASNGSTILTYDLKSYASGISCAPIKLEVLDMAVQISGTSIQMLLSIRLQPNHSTLLNHVWNNGPSVSNFIPAPHSFAGANLLGLKTINMTAGLLSSNSSAAITNSTSASSTSAPAEAPAPAEAVAPTPHAGTNQSSNITPAAPAPAPAAAPATTAVMAGCATSYAFNGENKAFLMCENLSVQGATIAWTLQNEDAANRTLHVLFSGVAPSSSGWVGWGLNLGPKPGMVGTQAFIAFQASNGSTILTYNLSSYDGGFSCAPIDLEVLSTQVQILGGTTIQMLLSLRLQPNQSTSLNHVWNRGPSVSNFIPASHDLDAADLLGLKTIDMATGSSNFTLSAPSRQTLKNRHGVLNVVGWGILLPCGVMAARYLRFADPVWFYLHVGIQICGFTLGVAGWATGLRLGSYSVGIVYHKHRIIGIVLFAISTLQMCAILMRPNKEHKMRKSWKLYHYTLGLAILVLGILNIFYGFDILAPPRVWRRAYVGVLAAIAGLALLFEVLTCFAAFVQRRRCAKKLVGANIGGSLIQDS